MDILGVTKIREQGGWLHVVTVRIDNGAVVTIEDDTDDVIAASDKENGASAAEIAAIWRQFRMGTSCFRKPSGVPEAKRAHELPHRLLWMTGEKLSHI